MRERGLREELRERVGELLKKTRSRVRVGGVTRGSFWTARGVKQGYPLSLLLFSILIADLEEEMGKIKWWRGVKLGGERVYTLAYAVGREGGRDEEYDGETEKISR